VKIGAPDVSKDEEYNGNMSKFSLYREKIPYLEQSQNAVVLDRKENFKHEYLGNQVR